MRVIRPVIQSSVTDRLFSEGVRFIQSYVVRHIDALRKDEFTPYSEAFSEHMKSIGLDLKRIDRRGVMTFLPYRVEYLINQIESNPPKRLLEVGAGSSTVLFAALAHKYGFDMVSLENHEGSVKYVDSLLQGTPFSERVSLQICDFRRRCYPDGKPYWWYAADLSGEPFDFVFVDGPMSTLVGRNGALPEVMPFLAKDAKLFIDDVDRTHERRVLEQWRHYFPEISIDEECPGLGRVCIKKAP